MQTLHNHYLQTMGIQVWRSRAVLPGAKPDVKTAAHFDSTADIEEVMPHEESGLTDTSLPPLMGGSPDALSAETSVEVIKAPLIPASPEKAPEPTQQLSGKVSAQNVEATQTPNPEFRIASIIFPGACLVVTHVPIQVVAPISSKHLAFLKELLLSIGIPIVDEPEITLFNWPMLRSADFDQSAEAAREASQAFLRGQKSKHSVRFVLLMGDAPGQYLLSERASFAEKRGRLSGGSEQPLLLTYSVDQAFSEPLLKAQIWHDLKPLAAWVQQD